MGSASGGDVYYLQFTIYNLRFAIGTSSCAMLVELFTIYSPPPSPTWNQARVALAQCSSFGKTQQYLLCSGWVCWIILWDVSITVLDKLKEAEKQAKEGKRVSYWV